MTESETRRTGTETILVVDDEAPVRAAIERALTRAGHTVLVAADGNEALAILETHTGGVDLVVSDIVMPNLGGLDFYRIMRAGLGPVRFLLISGYGPGGAPPDVAFLAKPFSPHDLLLAVRAVLDEPPR